MRILIGYNGSVAATAAVDDLLQAGLPDRAEVLVMTVAETNCPPDVVEAPGLAKFAAERLMKNYPHWKVTRETASGSPALEILKRAETFKPDLIVIGERRQALSERNIFLGHAPQAIITEAACSVRVARGEIGAPIHPAQLVVGFDGSAGAEAAVDSIISRSWPTGTKVCLLTVTDAVELGSLGKYAAHSTAVATEATLAPDWAESLALDSLKKLNDAGLVATVEVRLGYPKDQIIKAAETMNADCIFVGPHCKGNSFERFLLGSVSAAVAARAHCSVEVVRRGSR